LKAFFDVDGVLIDGWHANPELRTPWDASIEEDLGISREALQHALFTPRDGASGSLMKACTKGEADLKIVLTDLLPTLGYTGSVDGFLDYWFRKDSILNPDVLSIVRHLKQRGVELYVATNQEHHRAAYLWDNLGFKDLFEDIFHSARFGFHKDEAGFYTEVNTLLDIGSTEPPLFFDDSEKNVVTARGGRLGCSCFRHGRDPYPEPAIAKPRVVMAVNSVSLVSVRVLIRGLVQDND
jgi:putative hydrolase of the HAD superfamily